jgi:hypothetical protein
VAEVGEKIERRGELLEPFAGWAEWLIASIGGPMLRQDCGR